MVGPRQPYDRDDDLYLAKYIATYNPSKPGRMGNALYKRLVEDAEDKWPWSKRHSWQSWRERYKDNEYRFDAVIRQYQKKKSILPGGGGAEEVVTPGRSQKQNGRQNDSSSKPRNVKIVTDAPSSSQNLQNSKHLSTKSLSQKNPAFTDYSKAGEEEIMSDAPIPGRQYATSQGHRHVARKTARKTVAPTNRSEAEEDIDDDMTSGTENTLHRKRKSADGSDAEGEAKRRRIYNDTRSTIGTGKPPGRFQNGNRLDYVETDAEKPGSPYTNHEIVHQKSSASGSRKLSSAVGRSLDLLFAFNGIESFLSNENIQATVFNAAQLDAEEQRQVMEYAKSRVPQARSSATENKNVEDYKSLYPHLSDVDNPGGASSQITLPGAWNNAPDPATISEKHPDLPMEADLPLPVSQNPSQVQSEDKRIRSISPVRNDSTSPRIRHRVSNVKAANDFFETPPLSPEKSHVPQPSPSAALTPRAQDGSEERSNVPDIHTPLPKRDPPRFANGTFTNSFVPSNGRRVLSQKRGPDLNSDNDTEVIASDSELGYRATRPQTVFPSWPPSRKKKGIEHNVLPVSVGVESSPVQNPTSAVSAVTPKMPNVAFFAKQPDSSSKHASKPSPRSRKEEKDASPASLADRTDPGLTSSAVQPEHGRPDRGKTTHRRAQIESEAGPSRPHAPILPSVSEGKSDKAKTIHAWRLATPLSDGQTPSASLTAVGDPFLTVDHANRLRRQGKGKSKEREYADGEINRRVTFGGFSALELPEFDLRRKALRSSLAGNPAFLNTRQSFSSSSSPTRDKEQEHAHNISRRSSVAASIDLTLDFPSPGVKISLADQVLVDRAGLQFFIQSMAQNHGVSEDWVRRVYEERGDLQGTDRIIAKMRDAAERAFEEAIEREKKGEEKAEAISASTSRRLSGSRQQAVGSSAISSPNGREVDLSALSAPRDRSFASRPHAELLYTPADEDLTLARVRNQYVPPSASRAARFVRARARRSSGMTGSPLNPNTEGVRGDQEDSEKEEEEVTMALTPSHVLVNSVDSSVSEHVEWDIPSSSPASAFAEQLDRAENSTDSAAQEAEETMDVVNSQLWTAEEDRILQNGEDEDAIKAIAERKGKMAVKWRLVELNDDDLML